MTTDALNQQPTRAILIVDDQPLMREALGRMLAVVDPDATLLEADSVGAAMETLEARRRVSLAILDSAIAEGGGVASVERILKSNPDLPILVLSAQDDPMIARQVLDAGASGFVSKRSPTRVLMEVIRLVLVGGKYIPPQVLSAARTSVPVRAPGTETPGPDAPKPMPSLGLTQRQLQVLALLLRGQPNKLICRALGLQEGTVKTHIAAIFRALGVTNRTEAAYAVSTLGIRLPDVREPDAVAVPAKPASTGQVPARHSAAERSVYRAWSAFGGPRRFSMAG